MDALHLTHLILVSAWGGLVAAEVVIELAPRSEAEVALAARVHFWIDVILEIPLLGGVLSTGVLLASRSWPPSALLAVKMASGIIPVGLNAYCAAAVILRRRHADCPARMRGYAKHVRLSTLGVPFAALAAYLGIAYFS